MKTYLYLLAIATGITAISCTGMREKTADEMLKNPKTENEIYDAILNDSIRTAKFIDRMLADEKYKTMLAENSSLVKALCMSGKMESLMSSDEQLRESMTNRLIKNMEANSVVCDHTCTQMMESEPVRKYFMKNAMLQNEKKTKPSK